MKPKILLALGLLLLLSVATKISADETPILKLEPGKRVIIHRTERKTVVCLDFSKKPFCELRSEPKNERIELVKVTNTDTEFHEQILNPAQSVDQALAAYRKALAKGECNTAIDAAFCSFALRGVASAAPTYELTKVAHTPKGKRIGVLYRTRSYDNLKKRLREFQTAGYCKAKP